MKYLYYPFSIKLVFLKNSGTLSLVSLPSQKPGWPVLASDLGALAMARRVTGRKMTRGDRRTTLEPSLLSPSRALGTFEGFKFSDTFFGGSSDCRRRSRYGFRSSPHALADSIVIWNQF